MASANTADTEFPVQNLPYGRFRRLGTTDAWRIGVAIGDKVLDLPQARDAIVWDDDIAECLIPLAQGDLR